MKNKKQNHGFDLPKNYFEDFEDRLFIKLSEDKLPKESGFGIPDGYFDQLEDRVLKRVTVSEEQGKVIPLFSRRTLAYAVAIAACAVLVFSLVNNNNTINNIETIEISSIESYIEEGNLGIDSYDVASLLKEEDINNISLENDLFSEELLEEYLLENIDDSSILIE